MAWISCAAWITGRKQRRIEPADPVGGIYLAPDTTREGKDLGDCEKEQDRIL